MERLALLREHAEDLRKLSRGFDTPQVRDQLLSIAEWCERLADSVEQCPPERKKSKQTHPMFDW
jgi:hypothetical protein